MDVLRARLLTRLDELLNQLLVQNTPPHTLLQIEASLQEPQYGQSIGQRVLLDSCDIDLLKQQILAERNLSTRQSRTPDFTTPSINGQIVPSQLAVGSSQRDINFSVPVRPLNTGYGPSMPIPDDAFTPIPSSAVFPSPTHSSQYSSPPPTPVNSVQVKAPRKGSASAVSRPANNDKIIKGDGSAIDKLIEGIWEQIHSPKSLPWTTDLREAIKWLAENIGASDSRTCMTNTEFSQATQCCRQVTSNNRTIRALEVLVQANWIDCYDARLAALRTDRPDLRPQEQKKVVMNEACAAFAWSEKELRNRMGIWKGYREIKDNAGWSSIAFAGPGIYRFCKYRLGFDTDCMLKLRQLRSRAEVAADTLQPHWRNLLCVVDESTSVQWPGHPHDWTVSLEESGTPLPLPVTYHQWDTSFSFTHLEESIIDIEKFGNHDPRRFEYGPAFYCNSCSLRQSTITEENQCECFPTLYSPNPRTAPPVQIFQTKIGKNNGLIACCGFAQGQALGEFIGLITQGLADVDVMQSQAGGNQPYQIWQGRCGNFTRFLNHSCNPNCHFETFSWLGVQRIVVVSKGVVAGTELTVDYSNHYWQNLDKICLCNEPTCRYKDRGQDEKHD